ncbi:MAG: LLM class flavin-dependent oxidoreductase [Mycetocola sp.]
MCTGPVSVSADAPATGPDRLGFLLHLDSDQSPEQAFADAITLFREAERLGYHSGWLIARHFRQGNEHLPSPLVLHAAIAQHTATIRLGTAVVVLPLQDPIRVAEDATVVDAISGGRLELGVGSGPFPGAWEAFGRSIADRAQLFEDSVDRLHSVLEGTPLNSLDESLHPAGSGVRGRVWQASSSGSGRAVAAAQVVARAGDGLQLSRATGWNRGQDENDQAAVIRGYRDALPAGVAPGVLVSRAVYPADSREQARERLTPGALRWQEWLAALGRPGVAEVSAEEFLRIDRSHYGRPDDIAAALAADPAVALSTELLVSFPPAVPSLDEHLRLLRDTAEQVWPRLRAALAERADAGKADGSLQPTLAPAPTPAPTPQRTSA